MHGSYPYINACRICAESPSEGHFLSPPVSSDTCSKTFFFEVQESWAMFLFEGSQEQMLVRALMCIVLMVKYKYMCQHLSFRLQVPFPFTHSIANMHETSLRYSMDKCSSVPYSYVKIWVTKSLKVSRFKIQLTTSEDGSVRSCTNIKSSKGSVSACDLVTSSILTLVKASKHSL